MNQENESQNQPHQSIFTSYFTFLPDRRETPNSTVDQSEDIQQLLQIIKQIKRPTNTNNTPAQPEKPTIETNKTQENSSIPLPRFPPVATTINQPQHKEVIDLTIDLQEDSEPNSSDKAFSGSKSETSTKDIKDLDHKDDKSNKPSTSSKSPDTNSLMNSAKKDQKDSKKDKKEKRGIDLEQEDEKFNKLVESKLQVSSDEAKYKILGARKINNELNFAVIHPDGNIYWFTNDEMKVYHLGLLFQFYENNLVIN